MATNNAYTNVRVIFVALLSLATVPPTCLGIPGGINPVDAAQIPPAIRQFALNVLESRSNHYHARKIVAVTDASREVVAGTSYRFTLELALTECQRPTENAGSLEPMYNCPLKAGKPTELCKVTVWAKPWDKNFPKLTNSNCVQNNAQQSNGQQNNGLVCPGQNINPQLDQSWIDFKQNFSKTYDNQEEECKRRVIFEASVAEVEKHNEDFRNGLSTFTEGINAMSDMTQDELSQMRGFSNDDQVSSNAGVGQSKGLRLFHKGCPGKREKHHLVKLWEEFKIKYNKVYKSLSEECDRWLIFEKAASTTERHLREMDVGNVRPLSLEALGLKEMSDMTAGEQAAIALKDQQRTAYKQNVCLDKTKDPQLFSFWTEFKRKFVRNYATEQEECLRQNIFATNIALILQHNKEADHGLHSFVIGVNAFSDLTQEEISGQLAKLKWFGMADQDCQLSVYPEVNSLWVDFKQRYEKKYISKEEECRRQNKFEANLGKIILYGRQVETGMRTVDSRSTLLQVTAFSDLNSEEVATGLKSVSADQPEQAGGNWQSSSGDDDDAQQQFLIPASDSALDLIMLDHFRPRAVRTGSSSCQFQPGLATPGADAINDDYDHPIIVPSALDCQLECQQVDGCTRWTWVKHGGANDEDNGDYDGYEHHQCLLRSGRMMDDVGVVQGVISGPRFC